jgi:hypothetical protein
MRMVTSGSAFLMLLIMMSTLLWLLIKWGVSAGIVYELIDARVQHEQHLRLIEAMLNYGVAFCNEHRNELRTTNLRQPVELHIGPCAIQKARYNGTVTITQEQNHYRLRAILTSTISEKHSMQCLITFNDNERAPMPYTITQWSYG